MGDHLVYLRYHWFDQQIREKRYPNSRSLIREFGITERTAHRTLEAMRDDFGAPLAYDHRRKGFCYTNESWQLPPIWFSQEEVLALLVARNLLSCCAEGLLSNAIGSLGNKLLNRAEAIGLDPATLDDSFSAAWLGYSPTQAEIFRLAAHGLINRRLLSFLYTSPEAAGPESRLVEPHHLQHYMGTWVLLAYCRERRAWRKFLLARMERPQLSDTSFTARPRREWNHHLEGAYGIFQGGSTEEAVVRFSPQWGRRIKEQVWHPEQRLDQEADGHLRLTLPVADYREIKLRLMQYGAGAEVLAPPGLRAEIRREAAAMARLYQGEE